jgi:hypothetical protein
VAVSKYSCKSHRNPKKKIKNLQMVQDNGNLQLKAILNDFTAFKTVDLTLLWLEAFTELT